MYQRYDKIREMLSDEVVRHKMLADGWSLEQVECYLAGMPGACGRLENSATLVPSRAAVTSRSVHLHHQELNVNTAATQSKFLGRSPSIIPRAPVMDIIRAGVSLRRVEHVERKSSSQEQDEEDSMMAMMANVMRARRGSIAACVKKFDSDSDSDGSDFSDSDFD